MAEYIERESFREKLDIELARWIDSAHFYAEDKSGMIAMKEAIHELIIFPAADVAPVVRCKDCKHRIPSADLSDTVLCAWLHKLTMPKEGFCSYGAKIRTEG